MKDAISDQKVHWEASSYDNNMSFVSRFGEDIVNVLNPQIGERIIDYGCGTGDLAAIIASKGAKVVGVDISPEMVERARNKYPDLTFHCADGMSWKTDQAYDAVFSNAALHWMKDADATVDSMTAGLRAGGRLVVEFGGDRNVARIIHAVRETLLAHGREEAFYMPWYFPKIGDYASLLESYGMEVRSAHLFDRPTVLDNGEEGMKSWLEMFGTAMFPKAEQSEVELWIEESTRRLKDKLYDQGVWTADYRRLRMLAVKRG